MATRSIMRQNGLSLAIFRDSCSGIRRALILGAGLGVILMPQSAQMCYTDSGAFKPPGNALMRGSSPNTGQQKLKKPLRVLVLCTGNSCRSQLAEGLFSLLAANSVRAFSAGIRPEGYVHPLAIRVMRELGVDISNARSKSVDEFAHEPLDVVITVCDDAAENCPTFPGAPTLLHWPTEDPYSASGDDAARLAAYRRVRDELRQRIESFLGEDRYGQSQEGKRND